MPHAFAPRKLPRLLAVVVLASASGCRDDESNDDDGASASSSSSAASGESGSESGGDQACVDILEATACEAAAICAWDGVCHVHCPKIADEASCVAQGYLCYWVDGGCDYGGI